MGVMGKGCLRRGLSFWLVLLFSVFIVQASGKAQAANSANIVLPEGWTVQDGFDKSLSRSAGSGGNWIARYLRSPSGDPVFLQILPLEEAGPLFIPPVSDLRTDGLLGMGATYTVVDEGSFRAVLEIHPYLGTTATAPLPGGNTLVLESKTLKPESLLELCLFLAGSENGGTENAASLP